MAAPRTTIWPLEPHTKAKHEILRRYLQAWMPILSQGRFPELLYIDGFAGPGRYTGGEDGSPIIALDAALGATRALEAKIHFLFVESDPDRADFLRNLIAQRTIPQNFSVIVEGGITFEEAFGKHYNKFKRPSGNLIPTFAFIDPFGWTGAPMSIVKQIIGNPNCEILFNFMYEEITRFIGHPDQEANFDALFGTTEWRRCASIVEPQKRKECLRELYQVQLRDVAGAKYVRSFEMFNNHNRIDYYLYYATNNIRDLEKMKEAMWVVDESGEFVFSDLTDPNQFVLFEKRPNWDQLRSKLLVHFRGKQPTVEEIHHFVVSDTAFKATHYKGVLRKLEREERKIVPVNPNPKRKSGTYADPKLKLKFSDD